MPSGSADDAHPGRHDQVLGVCCLSLLLVGLDATIVNVALPAVRRSLHASVSGLQWTIDAYTLVIAAFLVLSGSLADRFGRKRLFVLGLAVFSVGSLLCGVAPNLGLLLVFRVAQGLGGSMLNPVALAIITNTVTDPRERARALGIWSAVFGASLALGPVVGGLLVTSIGWRFIFFVNVPVGALALVLVLVIVPESSAPQPRRVDPAGQLLVTTSLVSLIFAIIEGSRRGWGSPLIVALFAVAACGTLALVLVESHRFQPLIDVQFFRSAPFSGATIIAVCAFAALGGFLFLNTLYLQDVRGFSALHAGLLLLPMAAMIMLAAPVSGRLVGTVGPRLPLLGAGVLIGASGLLFLRLTRDTSTAYLIVIFLLLGLGFGLVNAPISNAAVSGMPREQAGVAASVASTSRQIGTSVGVAVTGSIVAGATSAGFTTASHAAWAVIAGCGVVIVLVGAVSTSRWAQATARRFDTARPPVGSASGASTTPA